MLQNVLSFFDDYFDQESFTIILWIHVIILLSRIISRLVYKRSLRMVFPSEILYFVFDISLFFVLSWLFERHVIEYTEDSVVSYLLVIPFLVFCLDLTVRFLIAGFKRRRHGQPFISNPIYLLVDAICYLVLAVYAFLTDKTSLADRIGVLWMFFFLIPLHVIGIDLVIRFAVFCYRKITRRNKAGG